MGLHDLVEGGRVDERESGDIHQEQAGLLGGFGAQNFGQCPGGDVGLAGEPDHGAGTAFAVFYADGYRQFSHTRNHVTPWGGVIVRHGTRA